MEDEELKKILESGNHIEVAAPCKVTVKNKTYHVKQISNMVRRRIANLEKEAYLLEEICKEGVTIRKAKRADNKIRSLHSKTAAYYLMNNWAIFFPMLFAIRWRILDMKDSEVTYQINNAGMNNKGSDFFLANWQITKAELALSTRLVGDGIKQYQERMEGVENMLAKDALGISKDNK